MVPGTNIDAVTSCSVTSLKMRMVFKIIDVNPAVAQGIFIEAGIAVGRLNTGDCPGDGARSKAGI